MNRITSIRLGVSAVLLSVAGTALPAIVSGVASDADREVIVIMRDQLPTTVGTRNSLGARRAALASAQMPMVAQLQQMHARKLRSFSTINAVAATLSKAQADELTANPAVLAVVPDAVIKAPKRSRLKELMAAAAKADATAAAASGLCNTLEPEALQLTNTAFADASTPSAQTMKDASGQPITGKGVKVAYVADGLDPNIAGFIRPDGSHVFIDYKDFTGDPAGTPTGGGEAFGDASSIAAQDRPKGVQLNFDISQYVNASHPLPAPCNIHIRGMAPGASLVGLNVFSSLGYTTTSTFIQAIEYAVVTANVDVINESFGGNPFPDNFTDPIALANDAAVKAGVVVVVSSGDSGSAGTLGSPSTDPNVISAGASTQYRLYAQTAQGVMPLTKGGYLSNNISSLSSGGFAQFKPRTIDVVAPGDLGWALCSTNSDVYQDCGNFNGGPAGIEDFGGTSEAAPLTAGEAALVIQAYRSSHKGADPSPATVKAIIMSTATDLGAPTFEQGAGLINSLAAVSVALAADGGSEKGKSHGEGLLAAPSTAVLVDLPNTHQSRQFTITNGGSTSQHLQPALQTLGEPLAGATDTYNLSPDSAPTYLNATGSPRSYTKRTFNVPAGTEHLDAAIAFKSVIGSDNPPIVYMSLLDPTGKQAQYSIPQGFGSGYGHVDVVKPVIGTWTVIISTRPPGVAGSYNGAVQFTWAAERFVDIGTVSPSRFVLAPGASQTITVDFLMPAQPGDLAAGVRFKPYFVGLDIARPEIPVTLRTVIPTSATGGNFTGTLTGGNGRAASGPTQTFDFDVPVGVKDMSLIFNIADGGYLLEGLLVDPQGMELSVKGNLDPDGNPQFGMQLFKNNPQPGRWEFVLLQNFTSSGNQTTLPFSARIGFNVAQVAASGLPNSAGKTLSASAKPVVVPVTVTNTGPVTETYFADARLSALASVPLTLSAQACAAATLPGTCTAYFVPTEVHTIAFTAQSTVPITMDAFNDVGYNVGFTGSPDIFAKSAGPNTVVASLTEPEIPFGPWIVSPSEVGPYGAAGVPTKNVKTSALAVMQPFDTAVSSDSGDIWADLTFNTNTFNPLVLGPGQTGTINVTITPDAKKVGKTVTGYVYIDTFNTTVFSGDEVVRIPYSYTVAD